MHSKLPTLILLAALVRSQTPTTSDGLPWTTISPCGLNCLQNAQGCASYTDISCICTNSLFQNTVSACIQANCPRSDLAAALALQVAECAGGGPWPSSSLITSSRSIPISSSSEPSSMSSSNTLLTSVSSSKPVGTGSPTTTPSGTPSSSSSSSPGTGGNSGAAVGRNGELFGSIGAVIVVLSVAILSFQ